MLCFSLVLLILFSLWWVVFLTIVAALPEELLDFSTHREQAWTCDLRCVSMK